METPGLAGGFAIRDYAPFYALFFGRGGKLIMGLKNKIIVIPTKAGIQVEKLDSKSSLE